MEALQVGQRVEFEGLTYTIINISKPIGTFEVYGIRRFNSVKQAFRYQLDVNVMDSDEDELFKTINLGDDQVEQVQSTRKPSRSDVVPGNRFASVADDELDRIEKKKNEKTTDRQTDWGVKVFKDWAIDIGISKHFENLSPENLNALLRRFYAEARTRKAEVYSKSALVGIRAAINRHLTSPPFCRAVNIMQDREFMSSNSVLTGLIKSQKRDGKDVTTHKEAISTGDLQKLYNSDTLSSSNPTSLIRKVWFDVQFHFGRRGREGLRSLRPDSFIFESDDASIEYVRMAYNEADKTHHGIDSREREKSARMYASGGDKCPIESLRLYLKKRNKANELLFQRPLQNASIDADCWYFNRALGARKLGDMMSDISKAAGLSRRYTNHCLRATSATVLSHAGVDIHGIMSITGHRNESSVRSYVQQPSVEQRRSFSQILQRAVAGTSEGENIQTLVTEQRCVVQASSSSSSAPAAFGFPSALFHNSTITGGNISINLH